MFGSCFATQVNVEEINQLDPETPTSEDVYQLVMSEIIVSLSSLFWYVMSELN
jgi:hypothetical protein